MKKLLLVSLITVFFISCSGFANAQTKQCSEENSLVSIRSVKSGHVEELVFIFKKPVSAGVEASSASAPFTDYGGEKVNVKGDHFKRIVFKGVAWMCDTKIYIKFPSLLIADIQETERFEGQIEYIIGLKAGVVYLKQYSMETATYKKVIFKFRK